MEESPISVFLAVSLSPIHLSLLSLMQWLITAHFKHGYSPLISSPTLPIIAISNCCFNHVTSSQLTPPPINIHMRILPPSITTRTFSKSALKSPSPIKMVRFDYRLCIVKKLFHTFRDDCFGFACKAYAYIPNIALTHLHHWSSGVFLMHIN